MKKRFLSLLLVVALVSTGLLAGCGKKKEQGQTEGEQQKETLSPAKLSYGEDGYASIAKNNRYELRMNATASSIQVVDQHTGHVWDSRMTDPNFLKRTDPAFDESKVPITTKQFSSMMSPFILTWANLSNIPNSANTADMLNAAGQPNYEVNIEELENGVRVTYDLKNAEIKVALDYVLEEKGLRVNIPSACIEEYGENSVINIEVLPYFAEASDTASGYYFYPDGSGAIMEFSDISHYNENEVSLDIYGNILNYKEYIGLLDEESPEIMLPVFGAQVDASGFLAIVTEGEESAQIQISPSKALFPMNSIATQFEYRRHFRDLRIEPEAGKEPSQVYDKNMITGDRSVYYQFLEKDKTTYNDMAKVYRNYLLEGELKDKAKKEDKAVPLMLDLFMAIKEEGFIVDPTVIATSFTQAETILGELEKLGVKDMNLQLKGWTKNGYYTDPVQFPVNSKIGGSKGLKNLLEYTGEKGFKVFLASNFLEAREGSGGFNEQSDVVYMGNSAILTDYGQLYLLSPEVSQEKYQKFEKDLAKYEGVAGIGFLSLGEALPYNYNNNNSDAYKTRDESKAIYQEILEESGTNNNHMNIVEGGNAYVLKNADIIMSLPDTDSGYQITTKSVPFYQLVAHGLIDYTGRAGNLSSDLKKETLKWAEYGYLPYFELTYSGSEDLMYTDYNSLYSSTYSAWLEEAASIYKNFNENLTEVQNAYMDSHEEVAADVFKVTYSNGSIVYVNYNDEEVTVDGVTIGAKAYIVKKG